MSEALRLDATVVDRFSRPLGELRAKMQAVTRVGQTGTKATSAEFERFHGNVQRVTASLRGGLEPSLAAVGLAGLGAGLAVGGVGAAIAGVVASIRKFSTSAIDMRNLSRETGVAISTIQQLQSVSEQFGAKSENIAAGLARFRSNIFDAKIGKGIIGEVSIREDGERLIKAMQEASPDKALDVALDFLEKQKGDPERQKRLANLIFGADDFQKLVQDGIPALKNAMTEAAKRLPDFSEEGLKKARGYQEAIAKLADQFEALSHKIGEITVPWLTKLIDGLDDAINKGKIFYRTMNEGAATLGDKLKAAAELDSELTPGSSGVGTATRKAIDWLRELLGIKEAGAAEAKPGEGKPGEQAKPGQGKPGSSPPGSGQFKFRDEIRVGVKEGFIEALRQMMRERVPGDIAEGRVWNASYGGGGFGGGGGGYSAVEEGLRRHGGYEGGGEGGEAAEKPRRRYSGMVGPHRGQKSILAGGLVPAATGAGGKAERGWWTTERQQHAYDVLVKGGVSPDGAKALISRWKNVESQGGPSSSNMIGGGHYGIAQWSRSRGKPIWDNPDFDAQLNYVLKELESDPYEQKHSAPLLRSAKTPEEGARAATAYERAEHYNPRTHIDDWTAKALKGTGGVEAALAYKSGVATAHQVTPGQTDPHRPGFDAKSVPFHDYHPEMESSTSPRPGAGLRAQYASPFGPEGPVSGARTGKATMEISLKNFPPMNTRSDGGSLFDQIEVRRGHGMQEAR